MNKKRLSVVMAGAMLASSVAPVLAEEVQNNNTEVSAAQKGELVNELATKIWNQPVFSSVSDNRVEKTLKGQSVYAIEIDGKMTLIPGNIAANPEGSESKLKEFIKGKLANLKVGQIVKLVNLGYRTVEENGKTLVLSTNPSQTYSKAELTEDKEGSIKYALDKVVGEFEEPYKNLIAFENGKFVYGYNDKEERYEIKLAKEAAAAYGKDVLFLTKDSRRLDFTLAKIKDSNEVKKINASYDTDIKGKFAGFDYAVDHNDDIANVVEAEYKITSGGNTYNTKDLYDGLFLTDKGYELLNSAKEVKALLHSKGITTHDAKIVKIAKNVRLENGKYALDIKIANTEKIADLIKSKKVNKNDWNVTEATDYNTYYISGDSKSELETLRNWLVGIDAKVDKIEGEDRYTTAVKIAKEEAEIVGGLNKTTDIVLVNGRALIDGLAAAPLAGSLTTAKTNAPILLTAKDELPKATQRYLRELIDQEINKKITVHIVGGEAVVSNNVKKQLRALGLEVERYAGANREETSMAVAKAMSEKGEFTNGVFVVGAEGEADAMSISGFAASRKAPVIVSGFKGLSEEAIDMLDGERVYVVGGDSRISGSEFDEIKAVADSTTRVYGSNRKGTNAAVINKFYSNAFVDNTKSVIVANDGSENNDKLVDALTVANLSAKQNAPIVLATKSLSKDQINAVVENAKEAKKVYRVGGDEIARSVVKTIAEALNIVNNEK